MMMMVLLVVLVVVNEEDDDDDDGDGDEGDGPDWRLSETFCSWTKCCITRRIPSLGIAVCPLRILQCPQFYR